MPITGSTAVSLVIVGGALLFVIVDLIVAFMEKPNANRPDSNAR